MPKMIEACPIAILALAASMQGQHFTVSSCPPSSSHVGWVQGRESACEVRSTTLPAEGAVRIEGENSNVSVVGADRQDIALEARVEAQASNHDDAVMSLHQIEIVTKEAIRANGPGQSQGGSIHNENWSVSYKLLVPRTSDIRVNTTNGTINVQKIVGGAFDLHTTNGDVALSLDGNHSVGSGISATTVNGNISFKSLPSMSAHLVADTVNGGIDLGTISAKPTSADHRHVDMNLGSGGPKIELETVNGNIFLNRRNGESGGE